MTLIPLKRKLRKVLFHVSRSRYQKQVHVNLPKLIQIEPTVRCNMHCETCIRDTVLGTYKKTDMDKVDLLKILRLFPDLECIKFQGLGEPLLTKNVEGLLTILSEKKIKLWCITNGTVLNNPRFRSLIHEHLHDLTVSIDSTSPVLFEKLRAGGKLDQIVKGTKCLIQERDKRGTELSVGITFCVSAENRHEIASLYDLALHLGIDYVSIVAVENWTVPGEDGYEVFSKFVRDFREHAVEVKASVRALQVKLAMKGIPVGYKSDKPRLGKCHWPFGSLFINVDGDITPCCIRKIRSYAVGNIHDVESFEDVWNGPIYQSLRQAHLTKDRSNKLCGSCPL